MGPTPVFGGQVRIAQHRGLEGGGQFVGDGPPRCLGNGNGLIRESRTTDPAQTLVDNGKSLVNSEPQTDILKSPQFAAFGTPTPLANTIWPHC